MAIDLETLAAPPGAVSEFIMTWPEAANTIGKKIDSVIDFARRYHSPDTDIRPATTFSRINKMYIPAETLALIDHNHNGHIPPTYTGQPDYVMYRQELQDIALREMSSRGFNLVEPLARPPLAVESATKPSVLAQEIFVYPNQNYDGVVAERTRQYIQATDQPTSIKWVVTYMELSELFQLKLSGSLAENIGGWGAAINTQAAEWLQQGHALYDQGYVRAAELRYCWAIDIDPGLLFPGGVIKERDRWKGNPEDFAKRFRLIDPAAVREVPKTESGEHF